MEYHVSLLEAGGSWMFSPILLWLSAQYEKQPTSSRGASVCETGTGKSIERGPVRPAWCRGRPFTGGSRRHQIKTSLSETARRGVPAVGMVGGLNSAVGVDRRGAKGPSSVFHACHGLSKARRRRGDILLICTSPGAGRIWPSSCRVPGPDVRLLLFAALRRWAELACPPQLEAGR